MHAHRGATVANASHSPWLVYSERYRIDFGDHVFPVDKYGRLHKKLLREGIVESTEFVEPEAASEEDILLVHTPQYLAQLSKLASTPDGMRNHETPVSKEILGGARLCVGGTILAGRIALKTRVGFHLGGGFHHAFHDHEEGFCHYNDVAIAIRKLIAEGLVQRVLIVDLDLHQGNGTAVIFADDANVFTFSMHEENIYPIKERSSLDVGLPSFYGDEAYVSRLHSALGVIEKLLPFDIAFYIAGADPYRGDKLGTLQLSFEGLAERDRIVFEFCKKHDIPVAVVLGGGYAEDTEDVVKIHAATVEVSRRYVRS
jgi:acetoin utilization deacetylase AcuC-like enzyme